MKAVLCSLAALLPAAAEAAPNWKSAPGGEKQAESGFSFDTGFEFAWDYYLEVALKLLSHYWEWIGLIFVLLVLYQFVRGPERKEAAATGDEEEIFFDEEDRGYR